MSGPARVFVLLSLLLAAFLDAWPGALWPSVLPVSALIEARMPVSKLGKSSNAKEINKMIVDYNKLVESLHLDTIKDTDIDKDNANAVQEAIAECQKFLVGLKFRVKGAKSSKGAAKAWSKNQKNALDGIEKAWDAEEAFLGNLKKTALQALGKTSSGPPLGGPNLGKDERRPQWIVPMPYFKGQIPDDISELENAYKEMGKGGGGSTAIYTMPFNGKEWRVIAKKDRTATYVDKKEDPNGVGPTEYEFSVYRNVYEKADSGRVDGLAIVYGWAWLNWGKTRLEQMVMKAYAMDGLKIMKILDDFRANEIISDDDYWNVIAYLTEGMLAGIASLHKYGYSHNDIKPDNFMIDSKGRVWVIDLNGASTFEVGPNALTKAYCPKELLQAAKEYADSEKTISWTYDNKALDMYLVANTVIHMTACPQEIDKDGCKPDSQKIPPASEKYNASFYDLMSDLKAEDAAKRPTVQEARAYDFLTNIDKEAARQILVNVVNRDAYIKKWQERNPGKLFRENIDVAAKKARLKVLNSRMEKLIEIYLAIQPKFPLQIRKAFDDFEVQFKYVKWVRDRLLAVNEPKGDPEIKRVGIIEQKWADAIKEKPPPDEEWKPAKLSKMAAEAQKDGADD